MFIRDAQELERLAAELKAEGSFALDTEFVRETTYRPRLCLVQIGTRDAQHLVDPFELGDLSPLTELLVDEHVEKVVHAGQQDFEIFFSLSGRTPRNVFDTQIAAALTGKGLQISYGRLVELVLGTSLAKGEQYTDWSRRPLSAEQLTYAAADVRYLPALRDSLARELEELGRLAWLQDESKYLAEASTYAPEPRTLYLRVKGAARLERAALATLQLLAAWREEEAARLDRPRSRIVRDEVLVEIARRRPRSNRELRALRGLHPRLVERSGEALLGAIEAARRLGPEEFPPAIERDVADDELTLVVALLDVVLQARAAAARVAPSYVGTRKDLTALARRILRGEESHQGDAEQLLNGWRREIAGDALLRLLEGLSRVAIDRTTKTVRVTDGEA